MITELHKILGAHFAATSPQQSNSLSSIYELYNPPRKIRVKDSQIARSYHQIVAKRDDHIIVHAWAKNYTEAIAYNTRNKTTGRITMDLLDMSKTEAFEEDKLYMATSDERSTSLGHVTWKAGDCIRVWNREDSAHSRSSGFCFNLASGQVGKFSTMSFYLELID
jgi:hypothetical protein